MAKMTLAANTFELLPEGVHIFKVMEVDDSKYEDYGKLEVKLQTKEGKKHSERFALIKNDGEINEGALKAWSYFARTCLNNFQVEEIDTQDIVGCYFSATVKHETYIISRGENKGKEAKTARISDWNSEVGFGNTSDDEDDLDEFDELDDLDDL